MVQRPPQALHRRLETWEAQQLLFLRLRWLWVFSEPAPLPARTRPNWTVGAPQKPRYQLPQLPTLGRRPTSWPAKSPFFVAALGLQKVRKQVVALLPSSALARRRAQLRQGPLGSRASRMESWAWLPAASSLGQTRQRWGRPAPRTRVLTANQVVVVLALQQELRARLAPLHPVPAVDRLAGRQARLRRPALPAH